MAQGLRLETRDLGDFGGWAGRRPGKLKAATGWDLGFRALGFGVFRV